MKLTTPENDHTVPVYTISGCSVARPLPDWLLRRRKRSQKRDAESASAYHLLQDFEFEEASNCVAVSEDGRWIMSTGTYKPQIHVHSTDELSLSFSRHTNAENLKFVLLSANCSDYVKSLHLQTNRTLEFHNLMGCYYETRIPRFGRDLAYLHHKTEALVPAVGVSADGSGMGEVFRLNLERGQFMAPYQVDVGASEPGSGLQGGLKAGAVNVAAIAETTHGLCAYGTSIGTVEFFDPRSRGRVAILCPGEDCEVTALDFSESGLKIAIGNSRGGISSYDLRTPNPLRRRDQGFGNPIKNLIHMKTAANERNLLLSADKRIIKIFDESNGQLYTSIEPLVDINDVVHIRDSGMLLTANEGKEMHSFFIPNLGPAPRWCSFLDNQFDEHARQVKTETYDNYKFLTLADLKSLALDHLVGKTNLLRPYMHGYFVAAKLYDQARLVANPYVWEEEQAKRIHERIEKERESRIRGKKKVKVNQRLVDKLLAKQSRRAQTDPTAGLLGESRFGKMFEDEEFKMDEASHEFRMINPSTVVRAGEKPLAFRNDSDVEDNSEISEVDEDEDILSSSREKSDNLTMRVSSLQTNDLRKKDSAFGSRRQKQGRIKEARGFDAVGEKQATFALEPKKKEASKQPKGSIRQNDPRRSASGNTFRRI